jgi:transposase, IS5 family
VAATGQKRRLQRASPEAKDFTQRRSHRHRPLSERVRESNRVKFRVRSKVERPFHVIKRVSGFTKVRYRVIHKNATRLFVVCGLANLYMVRRQLLRAT